VHHAVDGYNQEASYMALLRKRREFDSSSDLSVLSLLPSNVIGSSSVAHENVNQCNCFCLKLIVSTSVMERTVPSCTCINGKRNGTASYFC
jgi:hypothetical protein